jgi:hypothetical protein
MKDQSATRIIKRLLFWPNGEVLAFDENGEQMPTIQEWGWMETYFRYLEEKGYDPTKIGSIEAVLNDGTWKRIIPLLIKDGYYRYDIKPLEP